MNLLYYIINLYLFSLLYLKINTDDEDDEDIYEYNSLLIGLKKIL